MPRLVGRSVRLEHTLQFVGDGGLELVEIAVLVAFVGAPAPEGGGMAEAGALEVVERDLADERGAEADPGRPQRRSWRAATCRPPWTIRRTSTRDGATS